ncbi:MAG: dihydrodipicolinate synthase family protein [Planctomycetota bacterium]|nr:dihydrodipicolinate synthase family protein [Planctomycetota bacterium]
MDLQGIYPALMSPFKGDFGLDFDTLRLLVRKLVAKDVRGFYLCGTSGELFALTVAERKRIVETVREEAGGKSVIVHVGAMNANDAKELAKHAAASGCDAISAIPPFYCKYTKDEVTAYYRSLMDASGLKMFLYNIPAFTGVNLDVAYYRELLCTGSVAGVKHTSHNLFEMERLRAAYPEGVVLSGYDEVFCGAQVMGATGCIGTSVNALPGCFQKIAGYLGAGDVAAALRVQSELNTLIAAFLDTGNFFACVKHALTLQGIPMGACRPPFLPLSEAQKKTVGEVYARCEENVQSM